MKHLEQLKFDKLPNGKILAVSHIKTQKRLSRIPAKIFDYMLQRMGQEIDKDDICKNVWGDSHYFIHRSFDVHLKKVRDFIKATGMALEIPRSNMGKIYLFDKTE